MFIAFPIPGEVRQALWDALEPLRASTGGVAWVRPAHMHVTLVFLGELDDRRADRARGLFADPSLVRSSFAVRFQGLGAFPPRGAPRVVYAQIVEGATECAAYYDLIAPRVAQLSELDRRPFTPHITLGRVERSGGSPSRHARGAPPLPAAPLDLGRFASVRGDYEVDRCVLFESILRPDGPEYREVARVPFRRG